MFVGHRGISTGLIYEKKLIEIGFGEPGETHHGKKTKKWPFSVETPICIHSCIFLIKLHICF